MRKHGVFVCQAWSACAWRHSLNFEQAMCHGLWVDFDAVFIVFSEVIALSDALESSYYRR